MAENIPTYNVEPHNIAVKAAETVLRHLLHTNVLTEAQARDFVTRFNEMTEAFSSGRLITVSPDGTYTIGEAPTALSDLLADDEDTLTIGGVA